MTCSWPAATAAASSPPGGPRWKSSSAGAPATSSIQAEIYCARVSLPAARQPPDLGAALAAFEDASYRCKLLHTPRRRSLGDGTHELLACFDDDHAGKSGPQPRADPLKAGGPAHQPLPIE